MDTMQDNNVLSVPVMLNMHDGRVLEGDLIITIGGQLERTLNNEANFIRFEDQDGERFISKSGILEARERKRERRAA